MTRRNSKLVVKLKTIPKENGVYLMRGRDEKVIYVGKARDLSNRVRSYFNREIEEIKTRQLVENIDNIEWIVTDSELEALMLETNLIKKYRPRYNVLMKDDKNYVYIKITEEDFPRVLLVRRFVRDGSKYFGPYTNATAIEQGLKLLNRIFPFFTYQNKIGVAPMDSVAGKELFIKRSKSVWGYLDEKDSYNRMIEDFVAFMRGRTGKVMKMFTMEMKRESKAKNFEKAAGLRDRIEEVQRIVAKQKVITPTRESADVIGIYGEKSDKLVGLLMIRDGKMIDLKFFVVKGESNSDIIMTFVLDYYANTLDYPKYILLPEKLPVTDLLEEYLLEVTNQSIKVLIPQKGLKRKMVLLAEKNARVEYLRRQSVKTFSKNEGVGLVELLGVLEGMSKEYLDAGKWKKQKKHNFVIEGYDISNLGQTGVVGAMVVWEIGEVKSQKSESRVTEKLFDWDDIGKWKGGFAKSRCKRFEIKSFAGQDDFAALREVLGRRFMRKSKGWSWPNMVLIDGGKGQLSVVLRVLEKLGVDVMVLALAKQEEEIWLGKMVGSRPEFMKLEIDKNNPASLLLRGIRDEVHRFVLSYQKVVRKKSVRKSLLDKVAGLGPKKKKRLLSKYGSVRGVREAGEAEIASDVGEKVAKELFKLL
ncbi:excinuclease ABC subunit UvrC [Patescibacteria group bacterium]|nr:excinuclease ABC subunit UvrC [Patescibacteria group bacterium]